MGLENEYVRFMSMGGANPGYHLVVQMQPGKDIHPLARSLRKTDKHAPDSS